MNSYFEKSNKINWNLLLFCAIISTENDICPVGFCCIQRRSEMGIQQFYSVAIYCRLSVDDGTNLESMSIASQKTMLTEYVKNKAGN